MRSLGLICLGAVAGGICIAGSAQASGAPPATDAKTQPATNLTGVTVTAPKSNPTVSAASEFVRHRLLESPLTGQYSRFAEPVCVRVQGLPLPFNAFIAQRVIQLAAEVNAPVAKAATCTPNVQVIFTTEPQRLLTNIARKREQLLGYHYRSQYKRLATFSRPIQSWYVTRTRDTTGRATFDAVNNSGSDFDPKDAQFGGGTALGGGSVHGRAGSRLGSDVSSDIAFSLILGNAAQVANGKIGPLADYIAVLALARWTDLEHCNAVIPTILNVMAEACMEAAPEAVTSSDPSLLKALYSVDARETGSQQRMDIATKLAKAGVEADQSTR